jgi:hypothetical protein
LQQEESKTNRRFSTKVIALWVFANVSTIVEQQNEPLKLAFVAKKKLQKKQLESQHSMTAKPFENIFHHFVIRFISNAIIAETTYSYLTSVTAIREREI